MTAIFTGETSAQIGKKPAAKIGYVYPAGGQRGTTFEVWVCGRNVGRPTQVLFSGNGISARVVDTQFLWTNQDARDRWKIRTRIGDALEKHISDTPQGKLVKELLDKIPKIGKPAEPKEEVEVIPFAFPRQVHVRKLAETDAYVPLDEMLEIVDWTYGPVKYGPNNFGRPLDVHREVTVIEVTIAPDAELGDREICLLTVSGMTNPMYFHVGEYPEFKEREPNNFETHPISKTLMSFDVPVYDVPFTMNGQITHADIDRFQFRAKKGQKLVLYAKARQLVPYLANAVPGWFEAMITVYNEKGKELAFADCHQFDPDPVLIFNVPEDGVYTAEIRDSLFRGREDFVYRLSVAPSPLIEEVFPLGLKEGTTAALQIGGHNLVTNTVNVTAEPGTDNIRTLQVVNGQFLTKPLRYEVGSFPEIIENQNNMTFQSAQPVTLPLTINGRIAQAGETDYYRFEGKEGDKILLEVKARCLGSPLDSRLTLFDAEGKIIAENDDGGTVDEKRNYVSAVIGLMTHNADSKIITTLPKTGQYVVRIDDAARQGGNTYSYRLQISQPMPEFDVYTTPSSQTMPAANSNLIYFYVERKNGYNGPIELKVSGDVPGFRLDGGLIQEGETTAVATLLTPTEPQRAPVQMRFEAFAVQDGITIRRPVQAVEDYEQAFLYHHWVPAEQYRVFLQNKSGNLGFVPLNLPSPLVLKQGETIAVDFESTSPWVHPTIIYYGRVAPIGVWASKKYQDEKRTDGKYKLTLNIGAAKDALQKAADKEYELANPVKKDDMKAEDGTPVPPPEKPVIPPKPFLTGSLIITADAESTDKDGKKTRWNVGNLPAIAVKVIPE
ncbi:MAG: PPC domain-containing protein [Planctomycetaceae bacterium]|nr:PPC domain-containing protein [Planctomycetaceae bacterium]